MQPLSGKRFLVFVGDIYEDLELWYPKLRLIEAGAEVVVAGPCLLYTSPSPRDRTRSRMPSSA